MKKRYLFLDMLRGLAIIEMIHGHTLDALLSPAMRSTWFFTTWTYVRGFTAPVFLFAAGFAFAISTLPFISEYTGWSKRLLHRIRRILFIIILGYCLYLPFFSLQKTIASINSPVWYNFLRVDILRSIGTSLLILQFWHFLRPKRNVSLVCMAVFMVGSVVVTPVVSHASWVRALPDALKYYFIDSRFPLFPYAAYVLLGMFVGQLFLDQRAAWRRIMVVLGVSMLLCGRAVSFFGLHTALASFMTTGAVILLLCWLFERLESLWHRVPSPVLYFGQESLLVYVVHLIILYGSVLNKGLRHYWGSAFSFAGVYCIFIVLTLAMCVLAFFWHRLKEHYPDYAVHMKYSFYVWFIAVFIIRSY